LYNLPGAAGRIASRVGGTPAYENPITEQTSQFVDTGIATLGTYAATRAITGATSMFRNRGKSKLKPVSTVDARAQIQGNMQREFMKRGMSSQQAFGKASRRSAQFVKYSSQLKKFKAVDSVFRGLGKRLPAVQLASVAFELSRMANYTADRSSGMSNQNEYKENMTNSYHNLIENVGMPAMGAALGGLAGTALFPGVGTSIGLFGGSLGGWLTTFFLDNRELAEKVFSMIHEDRTEKSRNSITDVPDEDQGGNRGAGGGGGGGEGERQAGNNFEGTKSLGNIAAIQTADPEFMLKVQQVSTKYNLNPEDLLAIMYNESRLDPSIVNNKGGATGLIQFMPKTAEALGTTTAALRLMSRSGQMDYVDKYFEMVNLPKTGVDRGRLYSYIFLPGFAAQGKTVLASATDPKTAKYYNANKGLDIVAPFGVITTDDLAAKTATFSTASFMQAARPIVVEKPPEVPTPTTTKSEESEETEIFARAGLQASAAISKKFDAGFKAMGDRILGIEKTTILENPGYTHNDDTVRSYVINRR
jgi:hypothetical protein